MDPYERKKKYYKQSLAYDPEYSLQYVQPNQQYNARKHAYSVDHRHVQRQQHAQQYNNYNNQQQYIPSQQEQAQYHSRQIKQQRKERRKHRQKTAASSSSQSSGDEQYSDKYSKNAPQQREMRRRKARSKNMRDDNHKSPRKSKRSVPNVESKQQHNSNKKRIPHQSTPNAAMNVNGNRQQTRRRRKSKNNADDHQYQQQQKRPVAPRRSPRRSKAPDPQLDFFEYNEVYPHDQIKEKKRRHTTQPDQKNRTRGKPKNRDKRKRKKSSSKQPDTQKTNAKIKKSNHDKLQKGLLANKYVICEKLGKGSYGVVRRIVRKSDGMQFAAKIISKRTMTKQELQENMKEVDILLKVLCCFCMHPCATTCIYCAYAVASSKYCALG